MSIGDNIKKFRKAAGITQKELAQRCGFATGTIQQYELGKREPRSEQQERICEVLEIPLIALISGETDIMYNTSFLAGMNDVLEITKSVSGNIEEAEKLVNLKSSLLSNYQELNISGKEKAVEQVELLTKIPEYKKKD